MLTNSSLFRTRCFVSSVLILTLISCGVSRAAVAPGDIAIIGYQSDNPDALAFVVLSPVSSGEVIRFTDCGWYSYGGFRTNEGGVAYTAGSELTPGTVVSQSYPFTSGGWDVDSSGLGGSFALSTDGDQILVFQGDAGSPAFVYAIHNDSSGWGNATSPNTTALPSGLVNGTTAVFIGSPECDNGYYDGITEGTPEELRAAIGDPGNWVIDDSTQTWPSWSFNVQTVGTPAITDVWLSESSFDIGDPGVVTVQLDEVPEVGSPATVSVASGAFDVSPVEIVIYNPDDTGTSGVTLANGGTWTAQATAVSGCTGSATSPTFAVGPVAPEAYAGVDREVVLSGPSIFESMTGATANDANGLVGLTYEWTPATGPGIVSWSNRTGSVNDPSDPSQAQVTIDQTGFYTFTLTVTDPGLLTDQDDFMLTVSDSAPGDEYDPPADYYDPARPGGVWLTGSALKNALHNIIDGHTVRSYDDAKTALGILDEDPNNPSNLILIYTGVSVSKTWDGGSTWNREHMWPSSRNPGGDVYSDLFSLRPCNPGVNSSRGNNPYGTGSGFWDANQGAIHRGNSARAMFYDDVRYTELSLVNGHPDDSPSAYDMGDLAALLEWHYEDTVDERERRRNHLLYDSTDNPQYYQGNRNPFVDHPELVWTIWADHPNDAKLYVGASPPPDGTSSEMVDLGAVIVDGPLPSAQSVTLHKVGGDPTTFEIAGTGYASSTSIGPRQTFVGGTGSKNLSAGLSCSTTTAGLKTGSLVVNNTELTSAGSGQGSADGNDTIDIELQVREHAEASFDALVNEDTRTIDFGIVPAECGVDTEGFAVYNIEVVSGFTAALDLDSISPAGDTVALYTDLAGFSDLPAGDGQSFHAYFDTTLGAGSYESSYTLSVSDEDLPGTQSGTDMVLTLKGKVPVFPFDDNADGNVDLADFAGFSACFVGPGGEPLGDPCDPCNNHDADGDGDVDLADFASFQEAFTGE